MVVKSDVLRKEKTKARKVVKKDIVIRKTHCGRSVSHSKKKDNITKSELGII